jgi:hypothetical protein
MQISSTFNAQDLGDGVMRAAAPSLTRQLFYGAAISCAAGLAIGAWLQP